MELGIAPWNAPVILGTRALAMPLACGNTVVLKSSEICPALLDLGGEAPLVVLDDADLDAAVDAATFGAFFNQGQICMPTERIIVDAGIADDFVPRLARRAALLQRGDPRRDNALPGTLVGADAGRRLQALVDDAVLKGAVMSATVLDKVSPAMRLYHEESFGPLVTIVRVSGDDEALRIANDSPFGLSSAVFSRAWTTIRTGPRHYPI